jgi:hypothetical protein
VYVQLHLARREGRRRLQHLVPGVLIQTREVTEESDAKRSHQTYCAELWKAGGTSQHPHAVLRNSSPLRRSGNQLDIPTLDSVPASASPFLVGPHHHYLPD